jgi:hypothetical protein
LPLQVQRLQLPSMRGAFLFREPARFFVHYAGARVQFRIVHGIRHLLFLH